MTDRELMKQALDALIWTTGSDDFSEIGKAREGAVKVLFPAIKALRARLAQPKEPDYTKAGFAPPQREWQGLTDEEINRLSKSAGFGEGSIRFNLIVHAIEATLKGKNNA